MKKAAISAKPLVLAILFILTTAALFSIGAVTGYAATPGVTLCTDVNSKGDCQTLTASVPVIKDIFGEGKGVSSVSAPSSGATDMYFLCARTDYRFPCRKVQNTGYANLENLKFTLYGKICSVKRYLVPGCWVYGEKSYAGNFNDNVRSMIAAPWAMSSENVGSYEPPFPMLCTDKSMGGECLRVKSGYPELDSLSVKVTGEMSELDYKPYSGNYYFKFNDKFTSMIVPSGWTITAYAETDYKGKEYVFKGPAYVSDFSMFGLNGKISSIKATYWPPGFVGPPAPAKPSSSGRSCGRTSDASDVIKKSISYSGTAISTKNYEKQRTDLLNYFQNKQGDKSAIGAASLNGAAYHVFELQETHLKNTAATTSETQSLFFNSLALSRLAGTDVNGLDMLALIFVQKMSPHDGCYDKESKGTYQPDLVSWLVDISGKGKGAGVFGAETSYDVYSTYDANGKDLGDTPQAAWHSAESYKYSSATDADQWLLEGLIWGMLNPNVEAGEKGLYAEKAVELRDSLAGLLVKDEGYIMPFSYAWGKKPATKDWDGNWEPWTAEQAYTGYQTPAVWYVLGYDNAAKGQVKFLQAAQNTYDTQDSTKSSGWFMPVYNWKDNSYGKKGTWTWSGYDPNTQWAQFQFRAFAHLAHYYYLTGDSDAKAILDKFYRGARADFTSDTNGKLIVPINLVKNGEGVSTRGFDPGSFGLIAQGLTYMAAKTGDTYYLTEAEYVLDELTAHENTGTKLGSYTDSTQGDADYTYGYKNAEALLAYDLHRLLLEGKSVAPAKTPPVVSASVNAQAGIIDVIAGSDVGMSEIGIFLNGEKVKVCSDYEVGETGDFRCTYEVAFEPTKTYTYYAYAIDTDGQKGWDPAEGSVKIYAPSDTKAPFMRSVYVTPDYPRADKLTAVTALAEDEVQLSKITIYLDNEKKECGIDAKSGSCVFEKTLAAGAHKYYAVATDGAGNSARDPVKAGDTYKFTVEAAPVEKTPEKDTTLPTVSVAMVNKNTGKASDCSVDASAADNRILRKVEIYVDGKLKAWNDFSAVSTGTVSYTENFGWQPGTYKYYAIAYDSYLNNAQTAEKSFTISDTANSNCKYVESACPAGQTKDVKTGICKASTTGGRGIVNLLGGFVMSATAMIAAAFG